MEKRAFSRVSILFFLLIFAIKVNSKFEEKAFQVFLLDHPIYKCWIIYGNDAEGHPWSPLTRL